MRSYQCYAASAISDRVRKSRWEKESARGGYVWHTTGSGKDDDESFKSAQLIADSHDADKVVFLVDRIELGTQSLDEYRNFADDSMSVQATEDTDVLRAKLKSDDYADTLIVTSIQKMSNIHDHDGGLTERDLERIRDKRIVFIVDECHRSTFGDMMQTIRKTFPTAMLFGFTGTPIQDENQKKQTPPPTCSGTSCTAIASPTASATKTYWPSTPTWYARIRTVTSGARWPWRGRARTARTTPSRIQRSERPTSGTWTPLRSPWLVAGRLTAHGRRA